MLINLSSWLNPELSLESLKLESLEDLGSLESDDIILRYMELIEHVVLLPTTLVYPGTYGKNPEKIEPESPHQVGTHLYNPITSINFFFSNLETAAVAEGKYLTGFSLKKRVDF